METPFSFTLRKTPPEAVALGRTTLTEEFIQLFSDRASLNVTKSFHTYDNRQTKPWKWLRIRMLAILTKR